MKPFSSSASFVQVGEPATLAASARFSSLGE